MTLNAKSSIISLAIIGTIIFSIGLFSSYNKLHNATTTNLYISGQILAAESRLYKSLTVQKPDIEAAEIIISDILETMKHVKKDVLTSSEFHNFANVRLSFISLELIIKGMSEEKMLTSPELKQIYNELLKIDKSVIEFRESFRPRMDREMALKARYQALIFAVVALGALLIFAGFYRYFLRPILDLTSQVEAVRDKRIENISVYKGNDEIGRLSTFTHETINELTKTHHSLSQRYELQYAMSEILKAAQKVQDVDTFLKNVLDIVLSIRWLNVKDKGGIYLVDEADPDTLVLRADKNYTDPQKISCGRFLKGECICGKGAISSKTIFAKYEEHTKQYEGIAPHSHYCMPIKYEGKLLGVLNLYLEEDYVPTKMDMEFLDNISIIISEALVMKKLASQEHLIMRAIDESGEAMSITDAIGIIGYVNPQFEKVKGYSKDDIIGKNIFTDILWGDAKDSMLRDVINGDMWSGTTKGITKDNKEYYEFISMIPVKNEAGEINKFVYISRDMTKEKQLEEQLFRVQRMEVIGRFAGGVAHDFNNIITAIIGYANLLRMKIKEGDPLRTYIEPILSSCERAANLTKGILAFSRKQVINLRTLNLNEAIKRIEGLLLRIIGEDIEIKTKLPDEKIIVLADSGQIEQVLMNLCTNARDAMPNGGILTIETSVIRLSKDYVKGHFDVRPGIYALIAVSDTGIGMDRKTMENIFEPFYTTKEVGKGTGLGLSIVYGIIKQHNGDIHVYSEQGLGTTFKIYLPVASDNEHVTKQDALPLPRGGSETILLAEDDSNVRKMMTEVLQKYGYTIIEAVDGEQAINLYTENKDRIKLLLLDLIMPKMTGKEAYSEIIKADPQIKTIFLSGYADDIVEQKGMLQTDLYFLSKPVSPYELLRKIREVLDK